MDEDENDQDVVRQREVVVKEVPQPPSEPSEEQYQPEPEPESPGVECRFFTQSEFANADAKQKAFIQECDRAAGRVASSSSNEEAEVKDTPQERATQPEPQPSPPELQPKATPTGGDVDCPGLSSSEAQSYLLPGDPYDLDRDNDGIACD